ncbi:MAG: peptidoglycan-binding protein [Deltaproteobacteria bacterium]|nr:peptidoglycan-binding protein [Deltaproteobacteria bacterium]
MTRIRRDEFLSEMSTRALSVADARRVSRTLVAADEDGDGTIRGPSEWFAAFTALDGLERDRTRPTSLDLGTATAPTAAGRALASVRRRATTVEPSLFADIALSRAFPTGLSAPRPRPRGAPLVAVQWALSRLGDLASRVDGKSGPQTETAIRAFRARSGLPDGSDIDQPLLLALDAALTAAAAAPPVADPLAALSDFTGLTPIAMPDPTRGRIDWNHPEVQAAYQRFVGEYWPRMRDHRVECDCKTVGLFIMTQFRAYFDAETHHALAMPSSPDGRRAIHEGRWTVVTRDTPRGFFERTDRIEGSTRFNYAMIPGVEALDPSASMIFGTDLRYEGVYADGVYRVAHIVDTGSDNGGDLAEPEIDIGALQVGDMIFMNHNERPAGVTRPDTRVDHAMTVVGLARDDAGRVRTLVLAIGSFDDVTDTDSTTPPSGPSEINMYCEELTITFDDTGRVAGSETTWTSEPRGLVNPRYGPGNTIMEKHEGGSIFVGRWGSGSRR